MRTTTSVMYLLFACASTGACGVRSSHDCYHRQIQFAGMAAVGAVATGQGATSRFQVEAVVTVQVEVSGRRPDRGLRDIQAEHRAQLDACLPQHTEEVIDFLACGSRGGGWGWAAWGRGGEAKRGRARHSGAGARAGGEHEVKESIKHHAHLLTTHRTAT